MELDAFIAESLRQIVKGVRDTQPLVEPLGGWASPSLGKDANFTDTKLPYVIIWGPQGKERQAIQMVEFDVALTVTEETTAKAGAGLLTVVSAGASKEKTATQETASRIRFVVPLVLPLHTQQQPATPLRPAAPNQPPQRR